ncbi:MAG: ATP-binding cassette domain-containing protein [Lachnospiraceae bacterium]|nr:ATP-binding cassette domain-containing protein [Candidatus Colinaster equi]
MIKLEGVCKSYGPKTVLKDVNLEVEYGQIFGLIGRNGAGKTTLINIIGGLLEYDEGIVALETKDGSKPVIGYLPDVPAFFEYLTAGEYLNFLLMNTDAARCAQLLDMVDLQADVKIASMSRGMRQRLGIAAAMVNNPDIVLLDEPTSALDPQGRMEVMNILHKLRDEGKLVILSTHILADMEKVCDVVGFLSDGTIKRTIQMNQISADKSKMIVKFAQKVDITLFDKMEGVQCEKTDDYTVRFQALSGDMRAMQADLFGILKNVANPVVNMTCEFSNLDALFREVCL